MRHIIDFVHVLGCMRDDVSPTMAADMARFFDAELRAKYWVRALSLKDQVAKTALRSACCSASA